MITITEKTELAASQIDAAKKALALRTYFSAFQENPSPKVYGETADADGRSAWESCLGKQCALPQDAHNNGTWLGEEVSPYTLQPLAISYKAPSATELLSNATAAEQTWGAAAPAVRNAVLFDSLKRLEKHFFQLAYATMHTTGQGFVMAFQAAGPHAADRALEAMAMANLALESVPAEEVTWEKNMGKITLQIGKTWSAIPHGTGLVIGCSTFPTWNSMPGIYASLTLGAVVIAKPHPTAIAPLALVIACIQEALVEFGFSPAVCQMAPDTSVAPITKQLAESNEIATIDYTGGNAFGQYLESLKGKVLFTEKAGVNCVLVDEADDLEAVAANLAFSISLYSGQMCTAPHHIFLPKQGIKSKGEIIPTSSFVGMIKAQIEGLAANPKAGPFVLGSIQNPNTLTNLSKLEAADRIDSEQALSHPQFASARTATTHIVQVELSKLSTLENEIFGPGLVIIIADSRDEAAEKIAQIAKTKGAISGGLYTNDSAFEASTLRSWNRAGIPVSVNLTGPIYLNQNAAFSDFHVTGGNPAGNGTIADMNYITRRFFWVGNKKMKNQA